MAITIPQNDRFVVFTATAGQTTFGYDYPIYEDSDLAVYQITAGVITSLVLTTDYTVTGAGLQAGGNVVLVVGAALNDNIIISGDLPELRATNYSGAGDFTKESINEELNKLVQLSQQLRRDVDRSVRLDPADVKEDAETTFVLPLLSERLEKYLYFDANGDVTVQEASGVSGPSSSVNSEVALFDGTDGQKLKRPSTGHMIISQGTDAQRGTPATIALRGNTTGTDDVEAYVNGGWSSLLSSGTGAPIGATYITQTSDGTLTNEQAMGDLATGIVKSTTTTGVQSIAVDGTDYISSVAIDTTPQLGGVLDVNGNSIVSVADGDITIAPDGTGVTNINSEIVLTGQADPAYAAGLLAYSNESESLIFMNDEAEIKMHVGQENWIRVYNDSGATIANGFIVYATGKEDVEDRLTIGLAQADSSATARVIGAATHDIENNTFGFVTQFGYVENVDTSSFTDGASMWLSATVAGGYTDSEPLSPNVSVFLGFVVDSDVAGNGFLTTIGNTSGDGAAAGDATQLIVNARKGSVGTINKGETVYISGYNSGQDLIEVELADASLSSNMPAIGIANDSITNSVTGQIVKSGRIANIDTSAFTAGDEVFVSETAGSLTNTAPTGIAFIQKIGIINRSHASLGVMDVIGAGRSNAIPNFSAADKYWYGAATGTSAEGDITAFGRSLIDDAAASNGATTLGLGTGDNVSFLNGDFTGTEALKIPEGTTAQRPGTPAEGDFRINTTLGTTELYRGAAWIDLEAAGSGLTAASQTEMEAATSNTVAATPGGTQYHPGVAKFWVNFTSVTTTVINESYNVTSLADNGTGRTTVTIATDFSNNTYATLVTGRYHADSNNTRFSSVTDTYTVGTVSVRTSVSPDTAADSITYVLGFGDQ